MDNLIPFKVVYILIETWKNNHRCDPRDAYLMAADFAAAEAVAKQKLEDPGQGEHIQIVLIAALSALDAKDGQILL